MAVSLISNGTLIDQGVVKKMKQLHFSGVSISLYGATPETHEAVTGVAGSFSRTTEAIRLLRQNGFKVNIKTSVMKQNIDEVAEIDRWCRDVQVGINMNPSLCLATNGSKRPLRYRLSDEELRRYMLWEVGSGKKVRGLIQTCNAGLCSVSISAQGKVFPCVSLRLEAGDLRRESFARIWNESAILQWLRSLKIEDFKECFRCEFLATCMRCPGQSLAEERDMLAPGGEACRIAKMRQEVTNELKKYGTKEEVCQTRTNQA